MMNLQRIGTWILGAGFTGTIIFYSFFQPYIPGAVNKTMPTRSNFVFRADSLEELFESPVGCQLNNSLGTGIKLEELLASSRWVRFATPSEIAVADIPYFQTGQRKSWVAASWIGWRSPWLRWKLENSTNSNLHFIGKQADFPVWLYNSPDIAEGLSLSLSVTDNLFLACLSEQPTEMMILMLDAYDRSGASANL